MAPWWLAVILTGCGFRASTSPIDSAALDPDAADDPDGAVVTPGCEGLDLHTVALYTFDEAAAAMTDATGSHPGTMVTSATQIAASVPGRCGNAVRLVGAHGLVPDHGDFDLAEGSVDVYVQWRSPTVPERQAIVTRDANGTSAPGHFALWVAADGLVGARLQDQAETYRCSQAPLASGEWTHLAASWGPSGFALWIDGARQPLTTTILGFGNAAVSCGEPDAGGIAGNGNPWVVGAANWQASEGNPDPPVMSHLVNGSIDHLRIRDRWTDFSR